MSVERHIVDCSGEVTYSRNQSTGRPTQYHFINLKTGKPYCGWKGSFGAEVSIVDHDEVILDWNCCKRCLKGMNINRQLIKSL